MNVAPIVLVKALSPLPLAWMSLAAALAKPLARDLDPIVVSRSNRYPPRGEMLSTEERADRLETVFAAFMERTEEALADIRASTAEIRASSLRTDALLLEPSEGVRGGDGR